jgi:hypothetical protein
MKYLTTTEAAEELGVSRRRVQQMTTEPCPMCSGQGCKRCRQTGKRLPWSAAGKSGCGVIKLIPQWAMELPDVQERESGRPVDFPGVALERLGDGHYRVTATLSGVEVGEVVRKKRHQWCWRRGDVESEILPTREEAIKALIAP